MATSVDLLGPLGPLAQKMPGYEARPGQLEMATAVETALREDRVLLCEAGTGTGKTLAYLVPAILSGRKVVVSTATRALQEQIFDKDLPLIERMLGLDPQAALMKGLGNYLCRRRFDEFRRSPEASRPKWGAPLGTVNGWVNETDSGDVAELSGLGEDAPIFSQILSSSDTRVGSPCAFYDDCFVTRMKRRADAARLVVVNHHLFFADLALRGPHPGRVIPDYDAVIFDEAHQLEDIATAFFSLSVSTRRVDLLLKEVERALDLASGAGPLLRRDGSAGLVSSARKAADDLWAALSKAGRGSDGRVPLEPGDWAGDCLEGYHRFDDALDGLVSLAESTSGRAASQPAADAPARGRGGSLADMFDVIARRAASLRADLATVVDGAPGRVTWVETGDRRVALSSSPVDLSHVFRERVFESIPSVVMTSATLTGQAASGAERSDAFRFVRSRVGLTGDTVEVRELVVPSPFDFAEKTVLYLPDDLPAPKSPDFVASATARIAELVELTDGGAFVLTTSLRAMRALHRGLREAAPGRPVLVQGSAPKAALLATFRASESAVLVATSSFWQGVDVPGRALRLVVLEKIPFPVPSDPVTMARADGVQAGGGNAFMDFHVPLATIALKQGFGRLVRTKGDAGIVALLDHRVRRQGYGGRILDALPPARRLESLDEVRAVWAGLSASFVPPGG